MVNQWLHGHLKEEFRVAERGEGVGGLKLREGEAGYIIWVNPKGIL